MKSIKSENYAYYIRRKRISGKDLNFFELKISTYKEPTKGHRYTYDDFDKIIERKFTSKRKAKKFAKKFERKNKSGWLVPSKTISERQNKKKLDVVFQEKASIITKNSFLTSLYMQQYPFCMFCKEIDVNHIVEFMHFGRFQIEVIK
jgi:YD repeat-containing protein